MPCPRAVEPILLQQKHATAGKKLDSGEGKGTRRGIRVLLTCACLQDWNDIVESAGYRGWVTSGAQVELEVVQLGVGGHGHHVLCPPTWLNGTISFANALDGVLCL